MLTEHVRKFKGGQILLWCCAASTGEEPYLMAVTMAEAFGTLRPPVKILATDVDTNVLATAQAGVYPMERLEKIQEERLRRYFQRGTGARAKSWARSSPSARSICSMPAGRCAGPSTRSSAATS